MKILLIATALFLVASTATAEESQCDVQIRTANAMMEELQEQVRLMSARAAQYAGQVKVLSVNLDVIRLELMRTKEDND